jgi:sterol desaturase/sphingolipid hydroxylase (fatty acid hydroxylase superfamily)
MMRRPDADADVYFEPQNSRQPQIRLMKSDLLEALTRVHWSVVPLVWLPIIGWLLWLAAAEGVAPPTFWSGIAVGLGVWTLVEYAMHRFVFHVPVEDPPAWLYRLVYLFHGIHHIQPWDKTRLVMPPAVSLPLAAFFYGLFAIVCAALEAPTWLLPTFAGFLLGYVVYDLLHYATHHLPMRSRIGRYLKRNHLLHHHETPDHRYGVTSPLWDLVFGTRPRS